MSAGYHFKVRLGAVLIVNDQLLLARQNGRPFWVLPGGTLEVGEGMMAALEREILEEAALRVRAERLLYFGDFIKTDAATDAAPRQSVDLCCLVRYQSGELRMAEDENLDELAFFGLEDVRRMAIQPAEVKAALLADWESGRLHASDASARYLGCYGLA